AEQNNSNLPSSSSLRNKKSNHLLSIGTGSVIQRFALTQNPEIFKEVAQSATSLNISVLLKSSIGCNYSRGFGGLILHTAK
ncbi:MAG: hypothetical protein ACK5P2_04150, partial [Pseudanabaena sp.]